MYIYMRVVDSNTLRILKFSEKYGLTPIPLGVFRGKRKKRKEKKEIMGNYVYFLCSLVFILCKIVISINILY